MELSGLAPAGLILLAFIPFGWGLGLISAASVLTYKRGGLGAGLALTVMTLASGAYFPLELLPNWLASIADVNPLAIAIEGFRNPLLGGTGWDGVLGKVATLAPCSVLAVAAGAFAFRLALARERRRGTLALY
jgi:ABC-type polysaccharide/polyol phosphate export permease